ncbi:MAG: IS200/IS605 family transposase [Cyanobacteria bacterium NC_groundwater_1444_Ag_S-0.65um_54_12]|nr:IS200/IS605 family transposase [Cyanobacteria bacterium NC_groundwater_1444_Ag_S-0.65um_54_12]
MKITFFRAADRATYANNVHVVITTRGRRKILDPLAEALIEHFREVDNYGLDKIRGIAVADDHVHLVVAIPPNRSITQVAHRLKSYSSSRLQRENPNIAILLAGRGLWQRGYTCRNLGSITIGDLKTYLQNQVGYDLPDYA